MKLIRVAIERYKCFKSNTILEIAPLTIIVGRNNSGKSALLQPIHLLCGNMGASNGDQRNFRNLNVDGIRHARTFRDLINGRALHGNLNMTLVFADRNNIEIKLSLTIQNISISSLASEFQERIINWKLDYDGQMFKASIENLELNSSYIVSGFGICENTFPIHWQGILPRTSTQLPEWVNEQVDAMKKWSQDIRYLRYPRNFQSSALSINESHTHYHHPTGIHAPFILAKSDEIRNSVQKWYRTAFNLNLYVKMSGEYFDLMVGSKNQKNNVLLEFSGEGLSQVLPVAVTALTSASIQSGIDIFEHPESDLHPAAHAHVAELLLNTVSPSKRPMILETHSEIILLRLRRWIAERRLLPENVLIYWVDSDSEGASSLTKITINERGAVSTWPHGVFTEDYEEVMAIRRAVRDLHEMK